MKVARTSDQSLKGAEVEVAREANPSTDKDLTIIVNGRDKVVDSKELTFTDVVNLAFDNPPSGPYIVFTITYRKGHGSKPEGSLLDGGSVKVKDGMIFNVTATDKS